MRKCGFIGKCFECYGKRRGGGGACGSVEEEDKSENTVSGWFQREKERQTDSEGLLDIFSERMVEWGCYMVEIEVVERRTRGRQQMKMFDWIEKKEIKHAERERRGVMLQKKEINRGGTKRDSSKT